MNEEVLKFYLRTTEKRFDEIRGDLKELKSSVKTLQEFKMQNIASARLISLVVSSVCGFLTMMATIVMAYYSHNH